MVPSGDRIIVEYAKENNLTCVQLGYLGESPEIKVLGCFEHEGVANLPDDKDIQAIADRIFSVLSNLL